MDERLVVGSPVGDFERLFCHVISLQDQECGDLILIAAKRSIYSTKPFSRWQWVLRGSPGAIKVKYTATGSYVTVYVLFAAYTWNAAVFARTNGSNWYSSGTWSRWDP